MLKNFKDFLKESMDSKEYYIDNLFRKYSEMEPKEKCSYEGLNESVSMIGDGEIINKDNGKLMYKENINNDSLILVIHGSYDKSPFGGEKGYNYEIGIYKNDPTKKYVDFGNNEIVHTNLIHYYNPDSIWYNKNIISKVVRELRIPDEKEKEQ